MTAKKVTKKPTKKVAEKQQMYAMNSNHDSDLGSPCASLEEVEAVLDDWSFGEGEVITVYRLVPYKKFKGSKGYVEVE